jgi:hypothetical protein
MTLESFVWQAIAVWVSHSLLVSAIANRLSAALIVALSVLIYFGLGCAHATRFCEYHENGSLQESYTTSTIVGTGDTSFATAGCGAFQYTTKETGFSDNAVVLVPDVAEKVTGAIVPGGAAGAALRLIVEKLGDGE